METWHILLFRYTFSLFKIATSLLVFICSITYLNLEQIGTIGVYNAVFLIVGAIGSLSFHTVVLENYKYYQKDLNIRAFLVIQIFAYPFFFAINYLLFVYVFEIIYTNFRLSEIVILSILNIFMISLPLLRTTYEITNKINILFKFEVCSSIIAFFIKIFLITQKFDLFYIICSYTLEVILLNILLITA